MYIHIHAYMYFVETQEQSSFSKETPHKQTYLNRSFLAMPKRVADPAVDPGAKKKAPKCDAMGSAKKRLEELAKKAGLRDPKDIRSVVPCFGFPMFDSG